jgi:RNA polymerase sigma-70 factor (ECF subfamily)
MYRQVFLLRDVEGFDTNETAQALNVNVPTVKVRLHRARIMLQKQLVPQPKTVEARTPKRRWCPW